ncbi:hypothetical protein LRS37_12800 [Neobacillus sedimentimangrovi]|uniref:Uncharacterized protein n=1 Tax=Neobacillus sedimentimangrovi TaxID=2699460 RepID=A0ABS8QKH7_9BACI|nr:hypothetical protein [Neobacillus sedimentimangrovi]MCD4839728.1 hypothetical protein [Neobacillus sedimentimangrovi]
MLLPFPLKSNGFLDEEGIFKLVIGTFRLPLHYLEELTPQEIGWLRESHLEREKEKYEMIAYAFQVGYYRAKTGKKVEMFKKANKSKVGTITKEEKQKELDILNKLFD